MNLAKVQYLGIFTSNISEKFLYSVTRVKIFFFELQKNFGAAQPVRQNAFHTLITLQPLEQFWSNNHHFIGKIVNFCFFCIPIAVNLKGGPQCAVCVHILNQGFLALTHSNFNNKKKNYAILCKIWRSFWCNYQKSNFDNFHAWKSQKTSFSVNFRP